jgi:hypothetical protein
MHEFFTRETKRQVPYLSVFFFDLSRNLAVLLKPWNGTCLYLNIVYCTRAVHKETELFFFSMDVLPDLKRLVPLVTLRTAQTILSISLLQHLKSLLKSFSQFETEFDKNELLLKILNFSTWKKKKSPRVLNTQLIQARLTRWLSDMTWCC